ncbi:MAG: sigma-70 family RNA polymerase sigma factor [Clostridia bacterium]|nr:sigma-70 family RNA polymerase sigma factor [Clostridia bacterium]
MFVAFCVISGSDKEGFYNARLWNIMYMGGGAHPPDFWLISLFFRIKMEAFNMPFMLMLAFSDDTERLQFEAFYRQYERLLFKTAREYLREQTDCEDAVQETCRYLIDHYESLRFLASPQFVKYSVNVTANKAKDILKMSKRCDHEDISEYADVFTAPDTEEFADPALVEALGFIPARYCEALLQFYYYGFSLKDIAEMQGISVSAAKKLLQRSRDAVRKQLAMKEGVNA